MKNSPGLEKMINDYLHYGYLPPQEIPSFLLELENTRHHEYTVEYASKLLDSIFTDLLKDYSDKDFCIVPLSGGWDSRILLGMALKHFSVKKIKTYTFGVPGQLDFEIGKTVAKRAGVSHLAINLNSVKMKWEDLLASVEESPWTYVPDSFFNKLCYRKVVSGNDIIFSGFMGDPLTGGHIHKQNSEEVSEYFAKNQSVLRTKTVTAIQYKAAQSLPELPEESVLSWHELLDLGVRQAYCITPIVSSQNEWNSWGNSLGTIKGTHTDLLTPFAHRDWIQYWIQAPISKKQNRKLYLALLREKFPALSTLPSKNFYGAKRSHGLKFYLNKKVYHSQILLNRYFPNVFTEPVHMMNYLNYAAAFRTREDYRVVLNKSVQFLEEKSLTPWLDIEKYQYEHNSYKLDHSKLFLLLIGLALNLKVNGQI